MKRKGRLLYLGKSLDGSNKVSFNYSEIDSEDKMSKKWPFNKSLFRKGTIGSIYDCTFKNDMVSYNKNTMPTSFIKINSTLISTHILFPELEKHDEIHRQTELILKNSKKGKTKIDYEIEGIKRVYNSLRTAQQKSSFIANVIYQITK